MTSGNKKPATFQDQYNTAVDKGVDKAMEDQRT
jgi:hypothetical protein